MVNRIFLRNAGYAVFLGLVCLGVLLQMLGAPIIFWDLHGSEDDFISTILMGLTVHSDAPFSLPLLSFLLTIHISTASYIFLHEHSLFRPPVFS
jgi:hypothetical protein